MREVTDASFEQDVLRAGVPVVVDFWAPWCGPCRQLTPILEKAVRAAKGAVRLVKLNIDEHPQITVVREEVAGIRDSMGRVLSSLETEVLRLYMDGKSYQQIADMLGRHVKSIDNALQRIKRKLEQHLPGARA